MAVSSFAGSVKGAHSEVDVHYRTAAHLTFGGQPCLGEPAQTCHGSISQDLESLEPNLLLDKRLDGFHSAQLPANGVGWRVGNGVLSGQGWLDRWRTHR